MSFFCRFYREKMSLDWINFLTLSILQILSIIITSTLMYHNTDELSNENQIETYFMVFLIPYFNILQVFLLHINIYNFWLRPDASLQKLPSKLFPVECSVSFFYSHWIGKTEHRCQFVIKYGERTSPTLLPEFTYLAIQRMIS